MIIQSFLFVVFSKLELLIKKFSGYKIINHNKQKFPKVSIIIVVHNGLDYIRTCIESLQRTEYKDYEVIVVNNCSNKQTRSYLERQKKLGIITRIVHSDSNVYFCGGNNLGAAFASDDSKFFVLLNSDTVIQRPDWLRKMIGQTPKTGITSFGYAPLPFRPDGWCFLIPRDLFQEFGGLDYSYKMNWGITDLIRRVLNKNIPVNVVLNYHSFIRHVGGQSYTDSSKNMRDMNKPNILKLFLTAPWWRVKAVSLA